MPDAVDAPTSPEESGRLSRRAWGALIVLSGALFLDTMDLAMSGVALPQIRADLNISTSALQWVVSAYVIGYGGFLLLGGRAADLFGRRRVFVVSLGVFVVASVVSALVSSELLLIITRFVKGVSAGFTTPAGLAILTTSFPEGSARNKVLSVYTATGATGFSLGLVLGGVLTDGLGWRWVFLFPAPLGLIIALAALRLVPLVKVRPPKRGQFDALGAVLVTAAMLLLVTGVVAAPDAGWLSAQTLGSLAAALGAVSWFVMHERRAATPLVRLGVLRSATVVRANLGAMSLVGAWVGFQFIATLYMQELRDWTPLQTGLAILPGALIVTVMAVTIAPLIVRLGVVRMIVTGLLLNVAAYALFLRIGVDSSYVVGMLPTFILSGLGFGLAYGPLTIAATNGVEADELGLAGGLVNTSFQFGGALVLAVTAAVSAAVADHQGASQLAMLHGFRAGIVVSICASALGVLAVLVAVPSRRAEPAYAQSPER